MGKFYWLKLKRDFFKRHDIKIIKSMPNGKDYVIFYLELLCESLDHDGKLRFSDTIPYDAGMLAALTDTNIDIVRSAIKVLESLKKIEILDDGTLYMCEVQKWIGSATDNDNANRQRAFREREKAYQKSLENVTENNESIENNTLELDFKEEVKEEKPKKEVEKNIPFGQYGRVKLKQTQYDRLVVEFGKDFIDSQIKELDEYVQSNDNKNHYKDYNLVLRKAIRENWFTRNKKNEEPEWLQEYRANIEDGVESL